MLRSELVARLQEEFHALKASDVEHAVDVVLDEIALALASGGRVELRGFGAFSVRKRDRPHRPQSAHRRCREGGRQARAVLQAGQGMRLKVNGGVEP